MADQINRDRFIALLTERFPYVAAAIDDCSRGLLHLEMATLARATQAAVDTQDRDTVRRHFQFIDEVLRQADPYVENAVNVSYLENIRFAGRKAGPTKAQELLTPRLRKALAELEQYLAQPAPTIGTMNRAGTPSKRPASSLSRREAQVIQHPTQRQLTFVNNRTSLRRLLSGPWPAAILPRSSALCSRVSV
jgi:hypothetical protein